MSDIAIRAGRAADVAAVGALYDEAIDYMNRHVDYTAWRHGIYPTARTAADAAAAGTLFVAETDGCLAGTVVLNHRQPPEYLGLDFCFCDTAPEQLLVYHTLAVHPVFRRRGVAAALLRFADERARTLGCGAVRFDTACVNEPAKRLYERLGYRIVGTTVLTSQRPGIERWYVYEKVL